MPVGTPGGVVLDALGHPIVNCENGGVKVYEPDAEPCCTSPCEHCLDGVAPPKWLATFSGVQICDSCVPYRTGFGCDDADDHSGRRSAWRILSGTMNGSFLLAPVTYETPYSCDWDAEFALEARLDYWGQEVVNVGPNCWDHLCTEVEESSTYSGGYVRLSVNSIVVELTMAISSIASITSRRLFYSKQWPSSPLNCLQPYTVANYFQTCLCDNPSTPDPTGYTCTEPGHGGSVTLTPYYG